MHKVCNEIWGSAIPHNQVFLLSHTTNTIQSTLPKDVERVIYSYLEKPKPKKTKEARIEAIRELLVNQYFWIQNEGNHGSWLIGYLSRGAALTNTIVYKWDNWAESIIYETNHFYADMHHSFRPRDLRIATMNPNKFKALQANYAVWRSLQLLSDKPN